MQRLWAPWRKTYIRPKKKKGGMCVFCEILSSKQDAKNYVLKRNRSCFAVLNLFPYNNGHVLILPNRHVASISKLSSEEKLDWLGLAEEMREALQRTVKPHGFNLGINLGRIAGAGIPGHLHLHIVPRWKGDVNFMPVFSDTRVISESLQSLYKSVIPAIAGKRKAGASR
jgi:ATP adenylyltransferase